MEVAVDYESFVRAIAESAAFEDVAVVAKLDGVVLLQAIFRLFVATFNTLAGFDVAGA